MGGDLTRRAMAPVDIASLVVFRVFVGLLLSIGAARFLIYGWVERFFVQPRFYFKYWGFDWVEVLPPQAMTAVFVALVIAGLCVALGLFYRASITTAFVLHTYIELIDVTNYLNHYYLLSLLTFIMIFLPLERAWSLDARRKPELRAQTVPAWALWLVRAQIAVVYIFAGLAKFGSDWLLHAQPLGIWLSARTELPIVGPWLDEHAVAMAMSWGGFLYDTFVVALLLHPRTRPLAYAVLAVFHAVVGALFNIGMFPFIMVAVATIFFAPGWPRRLLKTPSSPPPKPPAQTPHTARLAMSMAAVWVLIQIAVPLRFVLYPGPVIWHEQGMRWAWKVMVREKNGSVTYRAHLPDTGRTTLISPSRYLTAHQEREMSGQPDLILQLAQHIARDLGANDHHKVEVRVDALVSLNGRPPSRLIDPTVDLTQINDGIAVARWILPSPNTPPIKLNALVNRR